MEIGIDIEENQRFANLKPSFIQKVYTENEIKHATSSAFPQERWCAIWCAKEAVIKALSNKTLKSKDIEILTEDDGKPYVVENDAIKRALNRIAAVIIKISLSHTKNYSTAVCLVY